MSEQETIVYVWRVLKFNDDRTDQTWNELSNLTTEYSHREPSPQQLGELAGAGRYLVFRLGEQWVAPREVEVEGFTKWQQVDREAVEA